MVRVMIGLQLGLVRMRVRVRVRIRFTTMLVATAKLDMRNCYYASSSKLVDLDESTND